MFSYYSYLTVKILFFLSPWCHQPKNIWTLWCKYGLICKCSIISMMIRCLVMIFQTHQVNRRTIRESIAAARMISTLLSRPPSGQLKLKHNCNFTFLLKSIIVKYFTMEVVQGIVKIYWTYSCMNRKVLKLISVR